MVTVNPRATGDDLTAKARIRNAALDLYAQYGEESTSLRAVAAAAGVTLGLVQHHFKTKAGLRRAVDQLVVDYFAQTVAAVPIDGNARRRRVSARRSGSTHARGQPAGGELHPQGGA